MKASAPMPIDIRLMNAASVLLLAGVVLLGLAAGLWRLMLSPVFDLHRIEVRGEVSRNNALTLQANVLPQLQGNFFTLSLDQVRRAFEAVPWVRAVVVHRQFPPQLRVEMLEHHPVALWGEEERSTLINEQGQIFEANLGEVEAEALPRLMGPDSQAPVVLEMARSLEPVLQQADMRLEALELTPRGSWRLYTGQNVVIELGRGQNAELLEQLRYFLRTLPQITARYGRTPRALLGADLRHRNGYALRLDGVTTTEGPPQGRR